MWRCSAPKGVTLNFTDDAVDALADLASDINDRVENIGARRLHTVLRSCWRKSVSPPPTVPVRR